MAWTEVKGMLLWSSDSEREREVLRYSLEKISKLSILFQEMFTDWKRGSFDFHWLILLQHSMFTKNIQREGKEKLPSEEELGKRQKECSSAHFIMPANRRKQTPFWLHSYLSPTNIKKEKNARVNQRGQSTRSILSLQFLGPYCHILLTLQMPKKTVLLPGDVSNVWEMEQLQRDSI